MDELRYRSQQSPRNEPPLNSLVSPPRNGARIPQAVPTHDPRATLPRRFTTDSGRVPTMSNITTQRSQEAAQDYQVWASVVRCPRPGRWVAIRLAPGLGRGLVMQESSKKVASC